LTAWNTVSAEDNTIPGSFMLLEMRLLEMRAAASNLRMVVDTSIAGTLREYSTVDDDVGLAPGKSLGVQIGRTFKTYQTGGHTGGRCLWARLCSGKRAHICAPGPAALRRRSE
jgi:hypothetical protein